MLLRMKARPGRRWLPTALGLLACTCCGDGAERGTGIRSPWLVAQRVEPSEGRDPLVRRLEPEQLLALDVVAGAEKLVEVDPVQLGAERLLVFGGQNSAHFVLEGPSAPVNVLELTGVFWAPAWITVHGMREGRVVHSTQRQKVPAQVRAQEIRVDLRALEDLGAVDQLAVHFSATPASFGLSRVELLRRPCVQLLPEVDGVGVRIRTETRPAIGISNRVSAVVPLDGRPGRQLSFDYGVPPRMNTGSGGVRLVVRLEDDASSEILPNDEPSPGAWRTVRLLLPEGRAADARLRLTLEADGGGEVVAAVGNFMILEPSADPRAVVLVTSDTHRADHLGCAAQGVDVQTPFLDSLADRGVRFTDCWSLSNVTNPSHISLHSGVHPRDTKIVDNHTPLARSVVTLAERFRDAGFHTYAAVSAPHLADELCGLGQGFQRYDAPEGVRVGGETLERVLGWLDEAPEGPVFLWLHLFDAHGPYDPPAPFSGRYYPKDADRYDPALPALGEYEVPRWDPELRDLEWPRAQYRAEVSYVDSLLARLFAHERLARAVAAVTADHGEALGEAGVYFGHDGLSRSTLAVPLILAGPGVPAGQVVDQGVHLGDISRTLLDIAGLSAAAFPGRSVLAPDDEGLRFAVQSHGNSASVRRGDWFLVLQLEEQPQPFLRAEVHEVSLFDVAADPRCETDLRDAESEVAAELRQLLVRWLSEAPEGSLSEADAAVAEETLEMLQELGYSDSGPRGPERAWIDPECGCEPCRRYSDG